MFCDKKKFFFNSLPSLLVKLKKIKFFFSKKKTWSILIIIPTQMGKYCQTQKARAECSWSHSHLVKLITWANVLYLLMAFCNYFYFIFFLFSLFFSILILFSHARKIIRKLNFILPLYFFYTSKRGKIYFFSGSKCPITYHSWLDSINISIFLYLNISSTFKRKGKKNF